MAHKILVLDDDSLVRRSVQTILKKEGYDPVLAKDAGEALEKVSQTSFDLIISDIRMPGLNGIQAIQEIRKFFDAHARKDIPIIFITGYADMSLELNAEKLGEVILKPFDLNRLVMTVREYL